MKKAILIFSVIATSMFFYSCGGNAKTENEDRENTEDVSSSDDEQSDSQPANEPKTFTVTAVPDTALLGKNKEVSVKIKDIKAVELSDPDGKATGMELTYKLELTNKNAIGGRTVGVSSSNFRLELDNGQKIAPSGIYVSAEPEETKTSEEDMFEVPSGAKPVGLSLFLDGTRSSVKLEMK